jgi:hypothetical protein
MKTLFFIFILAIFLNSCKEKQGNLTIDADVIITLNDRSGNDLLNPSNPNAYLDQNIKIFYLTNGVKKEQPLGGNWRIYDLYGKYQMRLGLNAAESNTITYIQWSENDTDTLRSEILDKEEDGFRLILCKKLWYKDSLVFTTDDYSKERSLALIK